jgi:hypothetical protein
MEGKKQDLAKKKNAAKQLKKINVVSPEKNNAMAMGPCACTCVCQGHTQMTSVHGGVKGDKF